MAKSGRPANIERQLDALAHRLADHSLKMVADDWGVTRAAVSMSAKRAVATLQAALAEPEKMEERDDAA